MHQSWYRQVMRTNRYISLLVLFCFFWFPGALGKVSDFASRQEFFVGNTEKITSKNIIPFPHIELI